MTATRRIEVRSNKDVRHVVGWVELPIDHPELHRDQKYNFVPKRSRYMPDFSVPEKFMDPVINLITLTAMPVCESRPNRNPYCWMAFNDDGKTLDQLHKIDGFIERSA